tara:strand:+ start:495 stop:710 length:216 start_codon:yes stop_codon:yes gene_type:complete
MSSATIISALDAAIEAQGDKPLTLTINNKSVTYRTLDSMLAARKYYESLRDTASEVRDGFKVANFKYGGAG